MKLFFPIIIIYHIFCGSSFAQNKTIEDFLNQQGDITYTKVTSEKLPETYYNLQIKQPIDHNDPSKGHFYQSAYLIHQKSDAPMILQTQGYALHSAGTFSGEVTKILNGNQLDVEHRFFGKSTPENNDRTYFNLAQASADLHRIKELFTSFYTNKWVTTGGSKGGTTSLFYNFFYPEDVTACVAYVAPLAFEQEDKRVYSFLKKVGTKWCRKKIKSLQTRLLKEQHSIIPELKKLSKKQGLTFNRIPFEEAYELAVLEFSFSFWQNDCNCSVIPSSKSKLGDIRNYFFRSNDLRLYSDPYVDYYEPHYYQAATEMGYYGYDIKPFKKHLKTLSKTKNPSAILPKENTRLTFNSNTTQNLKNWLDHSSNNIIYIYGALDPWTACGVTPSKNVNSRRFTLQGKHHMNARIASMNDIQKNELITLLKKWISE